MAYCERMCAKSFGKYPTRLFRFCLSSSADSLKSLVQHGGIGPLLGTRPCVVLCLSSPEAPRLP